MSFSTSEFLILNAPYPDMVDSVIVDVPNIQTWVVLVSMENINII